MISIQNTYNEALVFADEIDSGTEGLLRALCGAPFSAGSRIRVMPDVHAGKGSVIGTTMTLTDRVAPALVGVDIGCGITAVRVDGKRIDLNRLDKVIRERVPAGRAARVRAHRFAEELSLDELLCHRHVQKDKAYLALGTLGGGNHFIELDRAQDGGYYLVIHSGSRRLGAEVATHYQEAAFRELTDGTPYELAYATGETMRAYLHDLEITQRYAALNRSAIADEILRAMKLDELARIECIHNYVDTEAMILRKGAISARAGEALIIPMNMRDGCLIGRGLGNAEWNYSAPHGAGRLMSRAEAKSSFTLSQYKKEMKGIFSTCISRETLDESPMAYKPMNDILSKLGETAEITERLIPVYNFKAGEE
ncbi:MAG: RtcB family protein [Clostridia bacterium]|nr:RtcB family protein [Clostridia bacterium]